MLDRLLARVRKAPEKSSSVVHHNSTDSSVLRHMVKRSSVLRTAMQNGPEVGEDAQPFVAFPDLVGDIFRSYHTIEDPGVKNADEVKPSRELNRRIAQRRIATDGFAKLHARTRHDRNAATFATLAEVDELSKALAEQLPDFMDEVQQMDEQEQHLSDLHDQQDQPDAPDDLDQQIEQAEQTIAETLEAQDKRGLGQALTDAIEEAQEKAGETVESLMSLPGIESGSPITNRPDDMLNLVGRWQDTKEMRDLARQIGRFQIDMAAKREARLVGGPGEIVDITLGDELDRVLPSELALMDDPDFDIDFFRRYAEAGLMQYETVGDVLAGLGPCVAVIDGSLSMRGARTTWARAVGIALVLNLHPENRDSCMIEFGGPDVEPASWDFLAGQPLDPEQIIDFASHFFNSGTDITRGLERAEEFINGRPEFTRADVIVITDGEDNFEDVDRDRRDRMSDQGVRFHGVAIGHTPGLAGYLTQLCDTLIGANELSSPSEATNHLATTL